MRIALCVLVLLIYGCSSADTKMNAGSISTVSVSDAPNQEQMDSVAPPAPKSYEYLFNPMLADRFDFAVGDKNGKGSYIGSNGKTYNGWYIAVKTAETYSLGIHTGEDWNGNGGGNTDINQPVYNIAKGVVLESDDFGFPWGNVIVMEHIYLENAKMDTCYSLYAHLDTLMANTGDTILQRTQIGEIGTGDGAYPAHLHLEIRKPSMKDYAVTYWPSSNDKDVSWVESHYFHPSDFIKAHRKCPIPATMKQLVVACKNEMKIHVFEAGKKTSSYNMAVGQSPYGHKVQQGDNKTPEGAYKLIQKSSGPFSGSYADFFGVAWMRISYPNSYDAINGFEAGLISESERNKIIDYTNRGKEPPKTTTLGGGIGIHGWSGRWSPEANRGITWGCISINNEDLSPFYKKVEKDCEIYILSALKN